MRSRASFTAQAALAAALTSTLLTVSPARAAERSGRLLHPDGRPAAGYVVSVAGGTLSVTVAEDGGFRLDPAPAAPFQLIATGPNGEVSAPMEIAVEDGGPLELTLPTVVRDQLTVVSGVAPGLDLLPASASAVLSAEALEQRPPQRLVDTLESIAGASKLGEGSDSVPALRGLGRGRTLILIDGARVSAERRAGPSATFVDPASLASVEVLRGPGSVVYGSDAFGGVLHAVTRDPDPDGPSVAAGVEGSSGGQNQLGGWVAGSFGLGAGDVLVEAHAVDADEQEGGDGEEIFNSAFEQKGGAVRYVVPLGPGRLRASLQLDRVDDLGKAAIDSRQIRAVYPREDSDRLVLSWLGSPGEVWDAVETSLFYGTYRIVLDRDRVPTETSSRRIDRADTDAEDASLRVLVGREAGGGRLQLGADFHSRFDLRAIDSRVSFDADGTTVTGTTSSAAIDEASQRAAGLFATWTRPLAERWSLGLGARGDVVDTENSGGFFGDRSESAEALSGNVALTWAPAPGWSATAQVARGFRVPTLSDRYFRGPSGRGFVVGNPELDPETSLQFDLAVRRTVGRSALGLYAYRYEIDDLIERFQDGDDFHFRNRGEARLDGLEAEAQWAASDRWSLEAGAAWTRGRTDAGEPIDDQPATWGFVGARRSFERGYAFARLASHAEKDDPGPTELERAGYTLVDLGGGFHLTEAIELRLAVRNALDRDYFGAADDAADRSPGRSVTLGVTGRF
jgi:outer membrane receptor protein involved in Fe transport